MGDPGRDCSKLSAPPTYESGAILPKCPQVYISIPTNNNVVFLKKRTVTRLQSIKQTHERTDRLLRVFNN